MPDTSEAPTRPQPKLPTCREFTMGDQPAKVWKPLPDDNDATVVRLVRTGELTLRIRLASPEKDSDQILDMIGEAKTWLAIKGTDQWSVDWGHKEGNGRTARVLRSLKEGTTWLIYVNYCGKEVPVATVTLETKPNLGVWTGPGVVNDRAVYLSRLVTRRAFAGLKIGTAVINWVCDYGLREHDAKLVRIDVWTSNKALHKYYKKKGFRPRGLCPDKNYPARARFEKRTDGKMKMAPQIVR